MQHFKTGPEAEVSEILELALHRQQRLMKIDADGHGVELTGVALQLGRKRAGPGGTAMDFEADVVLVVGASPNVFWMWIT